MWRPGNETQQSTVFVGRSGTAGTNKKNKVTQKQKWRINRDKHGACDLPMKQLKVLTERWRDIVLSCVKFDWQPLPLSWFYVMLPAVHARLTLWQHVFIWTFFCCFFPVEFGWKPGYWSPWDTNSALLPPPSELQPQKWVMQSTWKEISNFNVTVKAASLLRHRSIIINIQYGHGSNRNTISCVWNERGRNSTCLSLILENRCVPCFVLFFGI